jgi:hypothetical protein
LSPTTGGREPLILKSRDGKPLATLRSGGQSPIQDKTWWNLWGLPEPKPGERPLREGRIVAYETSPLLDYAAGDATHSYPPTRVRAITRQFVYLRPDAFVIFDRVACAEAGLDNRSRNSTQIACGQKMKIVSELSGAMAFVRVHHGTCTMI